MLTVPFSSPTSALPHITWTDNDEPRSALWRSERGSAPPKKVVLADDTLSADTAYRLACEGVGLLWQGDFHNARMLVQALARRTDRLPERQKFKADKQSARQARSATDSVAQPTAATTPTEAFHQHRQQQSQRARVLGMVLVPLDEAYQITLRRAPDVQQACAQVWGALDAATITAAEARLIAEKQAAGMLPRPSDEPGPAPYIEPARPGDKTTKPSKFEQKVIQQSKGTVTNITSLRELLGMTSAHEWRKKGVEVPALGQVGSDGTELYDCIHPHYGVFSPVRGEYVGLVAKAPLPVSAASKPSLIAWDIGTGTGVLAAMLARRGLQHIVATDQDPRALACARDNLARLGVSDVVQVVQADLFPTGKAHLIVCNPPWLPARAGAPIEHAVYDEDSAMLLGFLNGLAAHLAKGGEGWLLMSDLAERLGLRSATELQDAITAAGLKVVGKLSTKPVHPKANDPDDALHKARAGEVTTLWRLAAV